jgi:hypothetical protein
MFRHMSEDQKAVLDSLTRLASGSSLEDAVGSMSGNQSG